MSWIDCQYKKITSDNKYIGQTNDCPSHYCYSDDNQTYQCVDSSDKLGYQQLYKQSEKCCNNNDCPDPPSTPIPGALPTPSQTPVDLTCSQECNGSRGFYENIECDLIATGTGENAKCCGLLDCTVQVSPSETASCPAAGPADNEGACTCVFDEYTEAYPSPTPTGTGTPVPLPIEMPWAWIIMCIVSITALIGWCAHLMNKRENPADNFITISILLLLMISFLGLSYDLRDKKLYTLAGIFSILSAFPLLIIVTFVIDTPLSYIKTVSMWRKIIGTIFFCMGLYFLWYGIGEIKTQGPLIGWLYYMAMILMLLFYILIVFVF